MTNTLGTASLAHVLASAQWATGVTAAQSPGERGDTCPDSCSLGPEASALRLPAGLPEPARAVVPPPSKYTGTVHRKHCENPGPGGWVVCASDSVEE